MYRHPNQEIASRKREGRHFRRAVVPALIFSVVIWCMERGFVIWNPRLVLNKAERAIVRALWAELRGSLSVPIEIAVPWLAASLEIAVLEGYGLQDIANWFGVNNSTVCLWLKRFGLKSQYMQSRGRVWSDAHNRFVPIAGEVATRLHIRTRRPTPVDCADRTTRLAAANTARLARHIEVCLRGHPRTHENIYVYHGKRLCRPCRTECVRNWKRAKRKVAA